MVEKDRSFARRVRKTGDGDIPPAKEKLRIGDRLPDFRLTDQQAARSRRKIFAARWWR